MRTLANVLVVDDNLSCLEFMTLAFTAQGSVTVMGETNPRTAVVRIRDEKPDLVVLDVKMPELDGFGVLSALRAEGNAVPVVMCSGSSLQKDIDRAYASGCNGYVTKPESLQDYRSMAERIIAYWQRCELPSH